MNITKKTNMLDENHCLVILWVEWLTILRAFQYSFTGIRTDSLTAANHTAITLKVGDYGPSQKIVFPILTSNPSIAQLEIVLNNLFLSTTFESN